MGSAYTVGGGGGKIRTLTENSGHALSKPYDIGYPLDADGIQQINEMLDTLFRSVIKSSNNIDTLTSSVAAITSDARLVTLDLSEGNLEAINTTPVQLIAAPGAGKAIIPIWHGIRLNVSTGYGTSPTLNLVYAGTTTGLCTALNPSWTSANVQYQSQSGVSITLTESTTDPRNKAINIRGSADPGSPGTGVADAIYHALYYIADYT